MIHIQIFLIEALLAIITDACGQFLFPPLALAQLPGLGSLFLYIGRILRLEIVHAGFIGNYLAKS